MHNIKSDAGLKCKIWSEIGKKKKKNSKIALTVEQILGLGLGGL